MYHEHGSFCVGEPNGLAADVVIMITLLAEKDAWGEFAASGAAKASVRQPIWRTALNVLRSATDVWRDLYLSDEDN